MKGQFDIIILNNHKKYNFLAAELKSPTGLGSLSSQQRNMADIYRLNNGQVLISNNYDEIILTINEYFKNVRIKCSYCPRKFISYESIKKHIEGFIKRFKEIRRRRAMGQLPRHLKRTTNSPI